MLIFERDKYLLLSFYFVPPQPNAMVVHSLKQVFYQLPMLNYDYLYNYSRNHSYNCSYCHSYNYSFLKSSRQIYLLLTLSTISYSFFIASFSPPISSIMPSLTVCFPTRMLPTSFVNISVSFINSENLFSRM